MHTLNSIKSIISSNGIDLVPTKSTSILELFQIFQSLEFGINKQAQSSINFHNPELKSLYCLELSHLRNFLMQYFLGISRLNLSKQIDHLIQAISESQEQQLFSENIFTFALQIQSVLAPKVYHAIENLQDQAFLLNSKLLYSILTNFPDFQSIQQAQFVMGPIFAEGGTAYLNYGIFQAHNSNPIICAIKSPKTQNPLVLSNFQKEVESIQLTREFQSPLVIQTFAHSQEHIVMETSSNATSLYKSISRLDIQQVTNYLLQAVNFLPILWNQGYFHGDFKMQNILLFKDQNHNFQPKLIDLTCNKFERINLGDFARTPSYYFEFDEVCEQIRFLKQREISYSDILMKLAVAQDIKAIARSIEMILRNFYSQDLLDSKYVNLILDQALDIKFASEVERVDGQIHSAVYHNLLELILFIQARL